MIGGEFIEQLMRLPASEGGLYDAHWLSQNSLGDADEDHNNSVGIVGNSTPE
jgi:hypothetical protein